MFDSNWGAGQVMCATGILAAIAGIVVYLVRAFRRRGEKPWPAFFVGIYNVLLLLLLLFGVAMQVSSEGFGFLPLMVLTTPWSWILVWLAKNTEVLDSVLSWNNTAGALLYYFASLGLPWVTNSCILYFLLKRHQKKAAEDAAWEQARRNR
jgi:hypothetical protein